MTPEVGSLNLGHATLKCQSLFLIWSYQYVNYSQKRRILKDNHSGVDSQNHCSIFMQNSPIKMFPMPVQIPEWKCMYVCIYLAWSSIAQSVCQQAFSLLEIGFQRHPGFESCSQQRKTTCLLSIRKSLACARASKLTTTNMYVCKNHSMIMCTGNRVKMLYEFRTTLVRFYEMWKPWFICWDMLNLSCHWPRIGHGAFCWAMLCSSYPKNLLDIGLPAIYEMSFSSK